MGLHDGNCGFKWLASFDGFVIECVRERCEGGLIGGFRCVGGGESFSIEWCQDEMEFFKGREEEGRLRVR